MELYCTVSDTLDYTSTSFFGNRKDAEKEYEEAEGNVWLIEVTDINNFNFTVGDDFDVNGGVILKESTE